MLTGKVRQAVRTAALVDRDPAPDPRARQPGAGGRRRRDVRDHGLRARPAGRRRRCTSTSPPPATPRPWSSDATARSSRSRSPAPCSACSPARRTPRSASTWRPGETCVFYTDGVTEAPGHRARFGDDRMREVLRRDRRLRREGPGRERRGRASPRTCATGPTTTSRSSPSRRAASGDRRPSPGASEVDGYLASLERGDRSGGAGAGAGAARPRATTCSR